MPLASGVIESEYLSPSVVLALASMGPGGFTSNPWTGFSIGTSVSAVVGVPGVTVGDFVAAAFDFLDGPTSQFDEFTVDQPDVEYDLSVAPDLESAEFAVYDRWNGVKDIYTFSGDGFGQLQVPLDNFDFSQSGQWSGPGGFGDFSVF